MPHPPTSDARARARPLLRARHAVAFVVLGWALSLVALVEAPLARAAQARAWAVARTIAESGDVAVPSDAGEARTKTPPLASWMQAGAMRALGTTDRRVAGFASWAMGILFALGPLLLGVALGRPYAGLLGSLLLVTSRGAIVWGASPEHDVPFAGLIALSLAGLARALVPGGRLRSAALAGLACGAAVLVKGPSALVFVLGTALAAGGARRARAGELRRGSLWAALLVGGLVPAVGGLAVLGARPGGVAAVFEALRTQALGEGGAHVEPLLVALVDPLGSLPKVALPGSLVWIPALAVVLVRRRRGASSAPAPPSFALRALGVILLDLTLVPAKQAHDALPALAPALLVGGAAIESLLRARDRLARLLPWALACAAVAFVAERTLGAALGSVTGRGDVLLAAQAVAVLALVAVRGRRASPTRLALLVLVGSFGTTLVAAGATAAAALRREDVGASVRGLAPSLRADRPVYGYAPRVGDAFDTAAAYLDRRVERVAGRDALLTRVADAHGASLLVDAAGERDLDGVRARLEPLGAIAPESARPTDGIRVYRVR